MKRICTQNIVRSTVLVLSVVLTLSGCLQSETVIQVRPDGSGEVVEQFAMAAGIVEMLAGFSAMGGDDQFSLYKEDELRARASQMGSGVRFLGVEETSSSWGEGYVARYAFSDINTLRVNQNPSDNVPMEPDGLPGSNEEYLTFSFRRGNPSTLEIHLPQPEESDSDEADEGEPSPDDLAAAMQFYEDMRVTVQVEVLGTVVATDAGHRTGNTVTIMDIDFNRILQNPELTRAILGKGAGRLADVQRLAHGVDGFAIESKERITITFR